MLNKYMKDLAIIVFAYWSLLPLVDRLVGMVIYSMFPNDPITNAVVLTVAFGLSYTSFWLFFNKWKAKFWIKACITIGIIIASHMISLWIDMAAAHNMTHPK